jgi:RNA polymerase-binding transcription factor DksA
MAVQKKKITKVAAPVKKTAKPAKKVAKPASKVVAAPKKAAPAKGKTAPKKTAPAKVTKVTGVKKAAAPKKAVPAKKAMPPKKAAPVKSVAPPKKVTPPAKKAVAVAKVKEVEVKKVVAKQEVIVKVEKEKPVKEPVVKPPKAKKTAKEEPVKRVFTEEEKSKLKKIKHIPEKLKKGLIKNDAESSNKRGAPKESLPREITPSNILPTKKTVEQEKQEQRKLEIAELASRKNIEIPKTSAIGNVEYNPNYAASVLDSKTTDLPITNVRYSDSELAEFRELIIRKVESARKELSYLQGLITRKDGTGDIDDGRYMTMEDGTISMEREQLSQMASRQIQFIDHLEKALIRIENKTYGICRITGKLIDKARLRAVPHATLSLEAKMGKA